MKGIKKLFFGLIFMTLVGVGFKVDVKAYDVEIGPFWNIDDEHYEVVAVITTSSSDFKSSDFVNKINCDICGDTGIFEIGRDSSGPYVSCDISGAEIKGSGYNYVVEIPIASFEDIYTDMADTQTLSLKYTAKVGSKSPYWTATASLIDPHVKSGKDDLIGLLDYEVEGGKEIPDGSNLFYLLNGDTAIVKINNKDGILDGLVCDGMTPDKYVEGYEVDDDGNLSVDIVNPSSNKSKISFTANFISDPDTLTITDEDVDAFPRIVAGGFWSKVLDYDFMDGQDISGRIKSVRLGKNELRRTEYEFTDSTFRFFCPANDVSKSNTDYKKLVITLDTDSKFTFDVIVADPNNMGFSPADKDKIYILTDTTTTITPTYKYGTIIDYDVPDGAGKGYFSFSHDDDEDEFDLTGVKSTNNQLIELSLTPIYSDIDSYTKKDPDTLQNIKTYKPKVMVFKSGDAVKVDDIFVNEGLTIWLWSFTDKENDSNAVIIDNNIESYVKFGLKNSSSGSISGKQLVGKIGDITIKGVKKADARTGVSIQPGDNSPSVTVYPKPNITKDSSSTSSSSSSGTKTVTHSITVTMPAGVYHGNSTKSIMDDDLDKMELFYVTSSGEEKSLGTKSLSTVSKDSLIKKWEGKVSIPSDAKAIIAYAYPDGSKDSDVYYRLDLDSSSSSTSSSSGSSSSSSSKSGGGSGEGGSGSEYDDVPKTGESKTDIWVLWTVLFIAILGAGFMIYKRFGLVRAIAEAEEEFAAAEHEERVEAARKEKEDKINMLKDLRNL